MIDHKPSLISTRIHSAGYPIILAFVLVTLVLLMLSKPLGIIGILLTAWCVYFFRDPERVIPTRPGLVVSPADGLVCAIETAQAPKELDLKGDFCRISIFLNVFDVHVNRIPIQGSILKSAYHPGQFLNASLDKASDLNERHSYLLSTPDSRSPHASLKIAFVQIAGLIARRIVSEIEEGEDVQTGQRFGIIRFGSRVDLYLPLTIAPLVCVGQRVIGGETVLADLLSQEKPREGRAE